MPQRKKEEKKPRKPRAKKAKTIEQKQGVKQEVKVNVRIDQSRKGAKRSGARGYARAPPFSQPTIIHFPSNAPVSEIRYLSAPSPAPTPAPSPAPSLPMGMEDNIKNTNDSQLIKVEEQPRVYVNPEREREREARALVPFNPTPQEPASLLGVAGVVAREVYPEYAPLVDLAGDIASQFSSADKQRAVEGLARGFSTAGRVARRVGRSAYDAWESLSQSSRERAPRLVAPPPSIQSTPSDNWSAIADMPSSSTEYEGPIYNWLDESDITKSAGEEKEDYVSGLDRKAIVPIAEYTNETLTGKIQMPKKSTRKSAPDVPPMNTISEEEEDPAFGTVAGRVMKIEKGRKPRAPSDFDIFRSQNKGRYTRAQLSEAWELEKKKRKGG